MTPDPDCVRHSRIARVYRKWDVVEHFFGYVLDGTLLYQHWLPDSTKTAWGFYLHHAVSCLPHLPGDLTRACQNARQTTNRPSAAAKTRKQCLLRQPKTGWYLLNFTRMTLQVFFMHMVNKTCKRASFKILLGHIAQTHHGSCSK